MADGLRPCFDNVVDRVRHCLLYLCSPNVSSKPIPVYTIVINHLFAFVSPKIDEHELRHFFVIAWLKGWRRCFDIVVDEWKHCFDSVVYRLKALLW